MHYIIFILQMNTSFVVTCLDWVHLVCCVQQTVQQQQSPDLNLRLQSSREW